MAAKRRSARWKHKAAPTKRKPVNMTIDCSTPSSERSTDTILKSLADAEIEALVAELETRGGTKVLHELVPLPFHRHGPHDGLRCAIIVDTETTGLVMPLVGPSEPKRETNAAPHAEIVSLAMVAIAYDPDDGVIKGAIGRFHAFNEPSHPIPPAATAIHGITDDDVRGKTISALEVAEFISLSAASVQSGVMFGSRDEAKLPLVIAHNARFDRRMLEHHFPSIFPDLPWACSQTQVPWDRSWVRGHQAVLSRLQGRVLFRQPSFRVGRCRRGRRTASAVAGRQNRDGDASRRGATYLLSPEHRDPFRPRHHRCRETTRLSLEPRRGRQTWSMVLARGRCRPRQGDRVPRRRRLRRDPADPRK